MISLATSQFVCKINERITFRGETNAIIILTALAEKDFPAMIVFKYIPSVQNGIIKMNKLR